MMDVTAIQPALRQESEAEYRQQAGVYLTSHLLADFRRSPLLYHRKLTGLAPDEDRPAYQTGRTAHTLILEGRQKFLAEYAIGGPINEKTGQPYGATTKAFAEWAAAQGKPVLTTEQAALIEQLAAGVQAHEPAKRLLSQGLAEGVARAEYRGVPCQIRIDWFNPAQGLVDLKTCDDLLWFEADARRYGYAHQLSFYQQVLAAWGGRLYPVHIVAVEKKEPFRCGVWQVTSDVLELARQDNEEAIARLAECRRTHHWPTGFEEVRLFTA